MVRCGTRPLRSLLNLSLVVLTACTGPCQAPCWLVPCGTPTPSPGGPGPVTDTGLVDPPQDTVPPVVTVQTEPETAFAVDVDRLIVSVGLGSPDVCPAPEVAGWTVRRLFYDPSDLPPDVPPPVSDATTRMCLYEREDPAAPPPFLALTSAAVWPESLVVGGVDLVVVHDRVIVAPAAVDEAALSGMLRDRWAFGAGLPLRSANVFPANPTRLVIVDSVPDDRFWPPDAPGVFDQAPSHGLWMAAFAQRIVCPDGQSGDVLCPVDLRTAQALGKKAPAYATGAGTWGTIADLAVAVDGAVRAWEQDRAADPAVGNLVLNLSVGWHPYFGGAAPGADTVTGAGDWSGADPWRGFPPDVQAVFIALARARCLGALAFSAAGNQTAGVVGAEGPLMPAGWDAYPVASIPMCGALGVSAPTPDPRVPLVVAVGGVDALGGELSVGRPASRPLFVADGAHAQLAPGESALAAGTPVLVGTSVSTVVVSATAALLWSLEQPAPTAVPAHEVLAQLLDGGVVQLERAGPVVGPVAGWLEPELDNRFTPAALFPTAGNFVDARAIRTCGVLEAAGLADWSCAAPSYPADVDFGAATATPDASVSWPGPPEAVPECGDAAVFRVPEPGAPPAADPCPDQQYLSPAISPWVLPQPDSAGCGLCFLNRSIARLYVQLPDLGAWSSYGVVVKSGTATYNYAIPSSAIPATGDRLTLDFPPGALPSTVSQASLVAKKADRVVIFPLLVTE